MSDLVNLFSIPQVKWIVVLIAIDVILGIIGALIKKEFVLGSIAKFMKKGVIAYVLGFAVLTLVGKAFPGLAMFVSVSYVLIILALVGSVLGNLKKIGIPVPKMLGKE